MSKQKTEANNTLLERYIPYFRRWEIHDSSPYVGYVFKDDELVNIDGHDAEADITINTIKGDMDGRITLDDGRTFVIQNIADVNYIIQVPCSSPNL